MDFRRLVHIGIAAAALFAGSARAETVPPLRDGIDETVDEPLPPALEIKPVEPAAPVRKRRKPVADPYAPSGLRIGSIALYPSVNLGTVYTTNVAKAAKGAADDFGLRLRPALRFQSDWSRHAWSGEASGDLVWYEDRQELNSRQGDISGRYRLDIRHTTRAEFDARYSLDQSGIQDSEVPDTATGNRTDHTLSAAAALIHDFGPLEGRLKAGASRLIFEDVKLSGGGTEDNADRNYVEPALSLRATYTDPPSLKPFIEAAYTPRLHDRTIDRNGLKRDSQGFSASAGITLDRAPFWSGEVALAYLVRDYEDAALRTNQTFGVNADLTWSPTELTAIVFSAATSLGETASASSSGTRNWTFGVRARHALRDNLDLLAGANVEFEKSSSGTDVTLGTSLGLEWELNPSWAWTMGYDGTWFDAATAGGNYDEHRFSVGLTLRR